MNNNELYKFGKRDIDKLKVHAKLITDDILTIDIYLHDPFGLCLFSLLYIYQVSKKEILGMKHSGALNSKYDSNELYAPTFLYDTCGINDIQLTKLFDSIAHNMDKYNDKYVFLNDIGEFEIR